MEINPQNLYAVQEVLADVQVIMDDEDNSKLTPGYYKAQVKYALDELGFDISFLPVTQDVPMPFDLMLDMPAGCFNLQKVHLFNGTPDNVGYTEKVYWKKGAYTRGKGTGFTSDVTGFNTTDPFCRAEVNSGSLYYFSIQNGIIRLSDACQAYPYVRLVFDGMPSKTWSDVKMVPPEVRKAVTDWSTVRCARALKSRDPKYRQVEADATGALDEFGYNGSWHEAKQRLLKLDKKMLNDAILYNARLNY
jgi:hypothetical protein